MIEAALAGLAKAFLMVAILTGLRHDELTGLRWSVIDWKNRILQVNKSLSQLSKKDGGFTLETPITRNAFR